MLRKGRTAAAAVHGQGQFMKKESLAMECYRVYLRCLLFTQTNLTYTHSAFICKHRKGQKAKKNETHREKAPLRRRTSTEEGQMCFVFGVYICTKRRRLPYSSSNLLEDDHRVSTLALPGN